MPDTMTGTIARYLVQAANHAPSADNSQPFEYAWNGDDLAIRFNRASGGPNRIFEAASHATLISLGAGLENIEQAAAAASLTTQWEWLAETGEPYGRLALMGNSAGVALPDDLGLLGRHTNRFPFLSTHVPDEILQSIGACTQGSARVALVTAGLRRERLVQCTHWAAEARFCNQDLHNWLMGSLRFNAEETNRGDGLDVETLNLPPGGLLFMRFIADWKRMSILNSLGMYRLLAKIETQLLRTAPAFVSIVGGADYQDTIEAGRLLERVWIDLNGRGLAVHPYYVITDQLLRLKAGHVPNSMLWRLLKVSQELPELLDLGKEEHLHMLLRVGYPRRDPRRSRRFPLSTIFSDIQRV